MVTSSELQDFVGAVSEDAAYVSSCLHTATALVDDFVGDYFVPQAVLDRCYLAAGAELFHARNAPNGISSFSGDSPIRIARDPLVSVYALLQPYVVMGV